jgi:hypothetical protein
MDETCMIKCQECQINPAAKFIGICVECLRKVSNSELLRNIHKSVRERFDIPNLPPYAKAGIRYPLCANNCQMGNGDIGFCGLHYNKAGTQIFHTYRLVLHVSRSVTHQLLCCLVLPRIKRIGL